MKKLFAILAIAGVMTSCKDKKEDKKTDETTVTTPTDNTTTTTTTTPDNTTTTTTTTPGVPSFSDPEVQKFANDYAAFVAEYKAGMKDPAKLTALSKSMQDWSTKSQSIGMKLAKSPEEATKWSNWVMQINKELMPQQ
jgi:hypothetical protein